MGEQDSSTTELDWTPTALGFARAYYAGALLAARHRPEDPHSRRRAEEAWNEYKEAARKAGHLSVLLPGETSPGPDEAL